MISVPEPMRSDIRVAYLASAIFRASPKRFKKTSVVDCLKELQDMFDPLKRTEPDVRTMKSHLMAFLKRVRAKRIR